MRGLSQSLLSLSFNMAGLVAGALLATYFSVLTGKPWALILYPGILSIRGAIGGLYSGRISTALHLGTIRPRVFGNTKESGLLFDSVTALTLLSSVLLGLMGSAFSLVLTDTTARDIPGIVLAVTATMGLSLVFISPITFLFSVFSYRRGLDPDVVVYPVISTVADIIVTACYLTVLSALTWSPHLSWWLIGAVALIFVIEVFRELRANLREEAFVETIREFALTLVLVSVIVNVTGSALGRITERIGRRPEVYIMYPAMIDTVGDVGSIVGSTATTKMALGLLPSSFPAIKDHLREIGGAWSASVIMFCLYALVSSLLYGLARFGSLFPQMVATNLLVMPMIILISYGVAIETRKRGLDPDNFIIPIETSLSDGLTTIVLLLVLTVLR